MKLETKTPRGNGASSKTKSKKHYTAVLPGLPTLSLRLRVALNNLACDIHNCAIDAEELNTRSALELARKLKTIEDRLSAICEYGDTNEHSK